MKKIIAALSILLLLSACTSNQGFPNDTALYTINDKSIKKSDLYQSLIKEDQAMTIYETLSTQIYDKIEIDETTLNELIEKEMAALKEVFQDELLPTIQSIGFTSIEEYIEKQLKPSIKVESKVNEAIKNNAAQLVETYKVKEIQFLMSDIEGFLEDQKALIEAGTPMADIKLDDKAKYFKDFVSKSIPLDIPKVVDYINTNQTPGLSPILFDKESKLYYLVEIMDTDMTQDLDRLSAILYQNEAYLDVYLGEQFKEAKLQIHDKELYKQFKTLKPTFIK